MADKKITALNASTALSTDDLFPVVADPSGSPTNKKITNANVFNKVPTFLGLNSTETVSADGALSITTAISLLNSASATAQTTLADSTTTGQVKMIVCVGYSNACDVDLTTTAGAGVTYTFSAVGEALTVLWTGAAWVPIAFSTNSTTADPATAGLGGINIT